MLIFFFDNIPECKNDFTFLQNKNFFEIAHILSQESISSNNNEEWKNDSTIQSIATVSIEVKNDINIPQIMEKTLSTYAVVDIVDSEIKCYKGIEKLYGL